MDRNDSRGKTKTTRATIRISKLPIGFLASVIVLSSIAAAQLFVSDNNAAFAAVNCDEEYPDGTFESTCVGGGSNPFENGGGGGRQTCTLDPSTGDSTCTFSGGGGHSSEEFGSGGQGLRRTETFDPQTGTTITQSGGHGGRNSYSDETGGGGGQTTCFGELIPGQDTEFVCSGVGGSGSKP